ncbi:MAG: M23 family metallopeptidase [Fibrobacter sp.]|nr:M23 family metallopeptidase [Fibrobacteraceae bacterium]MCF0225433.1 M23 family metallopeptidase [Fibrobacter sp.]
MKEQKYYTIQVIPVNSRDSKSYKINTKLVLFFKIFVAVFVIAAGIAIYNAGRIARILIHYDNMRVSNAQLIKQNKNYEELFNRLDSLWVLEERIQNILGTFVENDSAKISSLIDKNKFNHTPSEKIEVDYEGGWQTHEERMKLEHIPNVLPVIGIVSKPYSEEKNHLGTDYSAKMGNPVFASGSGIVIYAEMKGELGNTVTIDHQNGYISSYSHLKNIKTKMGKNVNKGDIIGTVGSTGNSNGPHLHYTITKNGKTLDAEEFFSY